MDKEQYSPELLPTENAPVSDVDLDIAAAKESPVKTRLIELFLATMKIGLTSFGAPTAHIAMMENEFVRKRKWITEEHFLDLLAAANLIPGPNASETCYHVGYVHAGYPGLIVAGLGFITPAFSSSL